MKGPVAAIKIEIWVHSGEIHVGIPVGIQITHVAPVSRIPCMRLEPQLSLPIIQGHVNVVFDSILLPVRIGIDSV